jgi:HAD superfamily hydrolase (TIGR01509 family)
MSDNRVRGQQWQRLIGEFFAPLLGATPDAWTEANGAVITAILEPVAWRSRLESASGYADFLWRYRLDWLASMCELVGVAMPPDEETVALSKRAERWVRPQVDAAFPGAAEAIRALHGSGYRLFTASGEPSEDLADYLTGMGVRERFEGLYGPDLVETFKNGHEYYERVFADAGVRAEESLVVDDSPMALAWAAEAGAATVLVGSAEVPSGTACIGRLRELPELLATRYG